MKKFLLIIAGISILFAGACKQEKPKSPRGTLELNSRPQGAEVIFNSKIKMDKQTPFTMHPPPATYLVKMTKENYLPAWQYVKIRAKEKTTLTLNLTPVKGSVLITSNPPGAKVKMDEKIQGVTPLVLRDLDPGEYSAQVEHVNRAPRVIKWNITDMRPKKISTSLESDIGTLVLITDPPKARVYLNDKVAGLTPFRTDLQEGEHSIKVALTGFADVKAAVNIVRDQQTTKKITMIHLPGTLVFQSTPPGALVYINDRAYGKTPLKVPDLQATTDGKPYKVRIEKEGFDSMSRDAYVTAGRENVVQFTMLRNTGGIDLIVNPPGVTVYVNGKKHSMTVQGESKDLSKVIHIRGLPAGKYQIMLAHKRMQPPTMTRSITVKKGKITRPKPINVWIANSVLKVLNEPQRNVLLYEKNKKYIVYSPEPGVKIRKAVAEIDFVRPLTEEDL